MNVIGWDVGGAHLKGARIENRIVVAAAQVACPLWQGLDKLDAAFAEVRQRLGEASLHAVTMTGELTDLFADRREGVQKLTEMIAEKLGEVRIYGGATGWLSPKEAMRRPEAVASANWHATAALAASRRGEALFADVGSTTTDIVPISGGAVAARGASDAERLIFGELVYQGATRTFLMALAGRVPFRGAWTPLMNEYFASTADIYRITGELAEDADRHPAADGREKTFAGSLARLARMIGRDAADADEWEWRRLAAYFAEAQLRQVHDAALQVLSAANLPDSAPIVAAGSGRFVLAKLAKRLNRPFECWEALLPHDPRIASIVSDCAPAVAVAVLLSGRQGSPP